MKIIFPLVLIFFVSFVFFPRELYVHKVFFVLENDKLIKKTYIQNVFCDCTESFISEFQNYLVNNGYIFVFHSKLWSSKDVVYAMVNNLKAEKKQGMLQIHIKGFFVKEIDYSVQTSPFNGFSGKMKILDFGFFTKIISNEKKTPRA